MSESDPLERLRTTIEECKKEGFIGERGLLGDSGFLPGGFHVNMPYDAGDKVFVEREFTLEHEEDDITDTNWFRVDPQEAKEDEIIRCAYCKSRPATALDHMWPYHNERTRCDDPECKIKCDKAMGIEEEK